MCVWLMLLPPKGPGGVCVCLGAIGFIFKDLTISHRIKAKPRALMLSISEVT